LRASRLVRSAAAAKYYTTARAEATESSPPTLDDVCRPKETISMNDVLSVVT
jgi:hypothetical protein